MRGSGNARDVCGLCTCTLQQTYLPPPSNNKNTASTPVEHRRVLRLGLLQPLNLCQRLLQQLAQLVLLLLRLLEGEADLGGLCRRRGSRVAGNLSAARDSR